MISGEIKNTIKITRSVITGKKKNALDSRHYANMSTSKQVTPLTDVFG